MDLERRNDFGSAEHEKTESEKGKGKVWFQKDRGALLVVLNVQTLHIAPLETISTGEVHDYE